MNRDIEDLFHEVADLTPAEREQRFAEKAVSQEMRSEVEALLRFDSEEDHMLTASVAACAEQVLEGTREQEHNSRFGPYRLLRRLGQGGMGTVYLAERVDGEIQHKVAIKFLHANRAASRGRFLRERQMLARLNHPSIAHVLDAGHTDDGRPYLVMEYVDGVPIDVYADKRDLRGKLGIFLRVCEAVAHAHRHLIIHRDLKPSNILVDSSGLPKLLDFGIARLLDEAGDATQTIERLATFFYASPEQLQGANQTTATDIHRSALSCTNC
jgi:serine/threonine-protein kinase